MIDNKTSKIIYNNPFIVQYQWDEKTVKTMEYQTQSLVYIIKLNKQQYDNIQIQSEIIDYKWFKLQEIKDNPTVFYAVKYFFNFHNINI